VTQRISDQGKKELGTSTILPDIKLPGIGVRRIPTLGQHAIGTTEDTFTDLRVPTATCAASSTSGEPSARTRCAKSSCASLRHGLARRARLSISRSPIPKPGIRWQPHVRDQENIVARTLGL
jgi:acyl-CoA dehydrogenase